MNRRRLEQCLNTPETLPAEQLTALSLGSIPAAVAAYISRQDVAAGRVRQTVLTLNALPITITDALTYIGTEIFDFPKGRISLATVLTSLAMTTTSAIASTLNSGVTVSQSLGTVAASSATLTSTLADLAPSCSITSSTTINVASATVNNALAASAQFDGTSTAKKMFLNLGVPTGTDIDADATVTISGTIVIDWDFLGTYSLVNGQ